MVQPGRLAHRTAEQGFKTPEQACATTPWVATSTRLEGRPGVHCEDCDIAAPTDSESPVACVVGMDAHACDDEAAERLWGINQTMLAAA